MDTQALTILLANALKELLTSKLGMRPKESLTMQTFSKEKTSNGLIKKRGNLIKPWKKLKMKPKFKRKGWSNKMRPDIKKVFVNFLDIMKKWKGCKNLREKSENNTKLRERRLKGGSIKKSGKHQYHQLWNSFHNLTVNLMGKGRVLRTNVWKNSHQRRPNLVVFNWKETWTGTTSRVNFWQFWTKIRSGKRTLREGIGLKIM